MTTIDPDLRNPVPPDLLQVLRLLQRQIETTINCVKIGVIQSFDAAKQEVTVQVAQQQVTSISPEGVKTIAEYPLLLNVPVYFPAGGGYTLTFPITVGDECLILFNDRELDNWLTSGPGIAPTGPRAHDLSDGIALVGMRSNPRALAGVSTTTTQLRNDSGNTFVEVAGGGIVTVTAPTKCVINSPILEVDGVLNVLNNNSAATPCAINGKIVATGDIVGNGISLDTHVHSGVTTGAGNTGGPH